MLFALRRSIIGLTVAILATAAATVRAEDPPAQEKAKEAPKPADEKRPGPPPRNLEDPPSAFVPLHPRTIDDQNKVEATRLFAAARALKDRHQLTESLDLLEKARKLDPESTAILRLLSKVYLALGRNDPAVAVARKIIDLDPGDSETLALLVAHYLERKGDPAAAEAVLKKAEANPKLDKTSSGYYLIQRNLGDLYADLLNRPEDAADAYARLMVALDERAANSLSVRDKLRIIDGDEAAAYLKFGEVFLKAKRFDPAILAFRRGLIYKPDHAVLPRTLAEALARSGKATEAMTVLEPYLKRQPSGSEPYELLSEILKETGKEKEILPRLEEAAKADPKNLRLQFLLVEQYRKEGKDEKADVLLRELLKNQAEPQVYAALAQSYLKEKKSEDLVRTLGDAMKKPGGIEAVRPTIDALADNPEQTDQALDAGLRMLEATPPRLSDESRKVLAFLAGKSKKLDKLVLIDRAALKGEPSPSNYRVLFYDLYEAGKYEEASNALEDLFVKIPREKTGANLILLSQSRFYEGKHDRAIEAAREARAAEPNDPKSLLWLGVVLSQTGHDDEAIPLYEDLLKRFVSDEEVIKRARSGLSTCYVNKGDMARGEGELETLLQKYPDDAGVNNDLGYLYADQGKNLEKAEAMIRKALDEDPENTAYLDSLGWVLFKRGKAKEALEPLEKAAKGKSLDITICEHLGDVLFRLQDYGRAKEYWQKAEGFAAGSKPPSKKLPDIRKKLAELEKLGPAPRPAAGEGP